MFQEHIEIVEVFWSGSMRKELLPPRDSNRLIQNEENLTRRHREYAAEWQRKKREKDRAKKLGG